MIGPGKSARAATRDGGEDGDVPWSWLRLMFVALTAAMFVAWLSSVG